MRRLVQTPLLSCLRLRLLPSWRMLAASRRMLAASTVPMSFVLRHVLGAPHAACSRSLSPAQHDYL
jgi:hypothetical protein